MNDYVKYLSYLVFIGILYLACHAYEVGTVRFAYEAGQTVAAIKSGFLDGGASGVSHLNQVFQDSSK
jgi:hypothetical protein